MEARLTHQDRTASQRLSGVRRIVLIIVLCGMVVSRSPEVSTSQADRYTVFLPLVSRPPQVTYQVDITEIQQSEWVERTACSHYAGVELRPGKAGIVFEMPVGVSELTLSLWNPVTGSDTSFFERKMRWAIHPCTVFILDAADWDNGGDGHRLEVDPYPQNVAVATTGTNTFVPTRGRLYKVSISKPFDAVSSAARKVEHTAHADADTLPHQAPLNCDASGGTGGLAPGTYLTTVAGLQSLVLVGAAYKPAEPTYLTFYLHGDGGHDHAYMRYTWNELGSLVDEHSWIAVAPLSPSEGQSWWTGYDRNREALSAVFEEIFGRYNVCRNRLLGSGASGGSWFWTYSFFAQTGERYPTYMNLNCGATQGPPVKLLQELARKPGVVDNTQIKFTYGTKDFLYEPIQISIRAFREAGFRVIVDEMADIEHCAFDTDDATRRYFESLWPILYGN